MRLLAATLLFCLPGLPGCTSAPSGGQDSQRGRDAAHKEARAADSEAADSPGPDIAAGPVRALVFSKTAGFRHSSISAGIAAITKLAATHGWSVTATEDATLFDSKRLAPYDVVIWLNTTGDVLNGAQQLAFEGYIRAGGGYVGVHGASDTEHGWPWYGRLVGAYFASHPAVQQAEVFVEQKNHPATRRLRSPLKLTDEWYDFKTNPRAGVDVLLALDGSSYTGGKMTDHPITWSHQFDGGRAFYTALGHTPAIYQEAAFLELLAGGIRWAAGRAKKSPEVLSEFDGRQVNGVWDPMNPNPGFKYSVTPAALTIFDSSIHNHHLVRRGVALDPARIYMLECDFKIEAGAGVNSFALNFNVAGADGDRAPVNAWSINLDQGVMKYMGFVGGVFKQIGQRQVSWQKPAQQYHLRVVVNATSAGVARANTVAVDVSQGARTLEVFEVDYSKFPYQPAPKQRVRVGANSHGATWTLQNLRVSYLD